MLCSSYFKGEREYRSCQFVIMRTNKGFVNNCYFSSVIENFLLEALLGRPPKVFFYPFVDKNNLCYLILVTYGFWISVEICLDFNVENCFSFLVCLEFLMGILVSARKFDTSAKLSITWMCVLLREGPPCKNIIFPLGSITSRFLFMLERN